MFVGREAELALLRAELRLAATGPARRVVIEGPEGIGKTALIRQALGDATGVRTLAASGETGERKLRFGLVRRLLPDVAGDDPWTVGQAVYEAIGRAQAAGPAAVLVDDAQWADQPSLRALCYAVRRLAGERVLVLFACRDADDPYLPAGLRRLLTGDGTRRISLQGLTVAELARLPARAAEGATEPGGRPRGDLGGPGDAAGPRRRLPGGGGAGEPPPAAAGGHITSFPLPGRGAARRGTSGGTPPDARDRGAARSGAPGRSVARPGAAARDRSGAGRGYGDTLAAVLGRGPEPPGTGETLPERAAARLHAHTLGNPLHARALLAAFPAPVLADPGVRLSAPVTYTRTFARRLRSCGPQARALVAACAVLGDGCTLYEAATVARATAGTAARAGAGRANGPRTRGRARDDRPGEGTAPAGLGDGQVKKIPGGPDSGSAGTAELDALERAVAAGILVEGPGRTIRFSEPLARAAAYDTLGAGARARLHLAAARIAADTGTELRHRAAAAAGPDEALAEELAWHAAKEAQHGLWHEAAAHLELSAGLTHSPVRRDELRTAALEHVLVGGDAVRAAQLAAQPNGDPRPVRLYVLGRLALAEGRLEEADRLLTEAWTYREAPHAADIAERIAWLRLLADEREEAATWARVALAQPIQSPAARPYDVLALAGEDVPQAPPGSLAEALRLLREDQVGQAREVLERAAGELAGAGLLCHRLLAVALLAVAEYRDGRWDDAVARAERAVAEATGLGQRWLLPCLEVVCVAPLAARGEHARALAHVAAAREEARRQRNLLGETQADLAMAVLGAGAAPPSAGDAFVPDPRPQLIETLVAEGSLEEAEAVLQGMSDTGCGPRARAQRARLKGLLLAARNVPAAAEEQFTTALGLARGECPMEEARVLLDLGRLLRRTGRRRVAAERLQAARAIFAGLGAKPMVTRCARELEACGLEPAVTARLGLTPQEYSTATLVADGLTNRQIARELLISVKTVEYHIGKIYTKLGIGSRVALAAKLAAYGENP